MVRDGRPGIFVEELIPMEYTLTIPAIPYGQDFAKDSFWWTYRERFDKPIRMGWKVKPAAFAWFDRMEKRAALLGQPFPQKPTFCTKGRPMPQPWTGRDEKPGRVPTP